MSNCLLIRYSGKIWEYLCEIFLLGQWWYMSYCLLLIRFSDKIFEYLDEIFLPGQWWCPSGWMTETATILLMVLVFIYKIAEIFLPIRYSWADIRIFVWYIFARVLSRAMMMPVWMSANKMFWENIWIFLWDIFARAMVMPVWVDDWDCYYLNDGVIVII